MNTAAEVWDQACATLRSLLNEDTYDRWITGIVPVRLENGTMVLGVSNNMFSDWLDLNYKDLITSALEEAAGTALAIEFESGHEAPVTAPSPSGAGEKKKRRGRRKAPKSDIPVSADGTPLFNRRFTFETFVVGDNSRFAHAACCAVANAPGKAYNPLFIYSPTGLGKTHLLQATALEVYRQNPRVRIEYISSEEFSNQYIEALKSSSLSAFRNRYRNVDLLLIDDVHFFKGKERFQEEFFHTFNALFHAHKQIVLTSDCPPHEIGGLEKRLVSRFEWGLTTDIGLPDLETRLAILKKKQEEHAVKLDDDVLLFIASRIKSNIRRLEGALIQLVSFASVTGMAVNAETAETLLAPILAEEATSLVSVEQIQRTVAEFYDIRLADMTSKRRPKNIAFPRQVAMYLCRKLTDYSSPAIAEHFNRNHATVLHAVSTIEERLAKNADFRRELNILERRIKA